VANAVQSLSFVPDTCYCMFILCLRYMFGVAFPTEVKPVYASSLG